MLKFFISLRNFFYTRNRNNLNGNFFDYRMSMSALFIFHYFTWLAVLDIILKKFYNRLPITEWLKGNGIAENTFKNFAFFAPLVLFMLIVFKILNKYEVEIMNSIQLRKWLYVSVFIFASGIILFLFLPRFVLINLG